MFTWCKMEIKLTCRTIWSNNWKWKDSSKREGMDYFTDNELGKAKNFVRRPIF